MPLNHPSKPCHYKQQHKLAQTLLSHLLETIIFDTALLFIMIWSEVKYRHCDPLD
jgi:hypothetical protein